MMNKANHIMRLHNAPFLLIKSGTKTIEMRVNDEKRRLLNIGDTITFISRTTEEEIVTCITNLHLFKDFKELYKNFDQVTIGYKSDDDIDPKDMEQYYDEEDIKKYGTVAIEIKKIED